MHPILADRRILALYLIVWLALALLLSALLAVPGTVSGAGALAFCIPLMILYAFVSLSSWYICRAFPLDRTNIARLLLTNILAAVLSSALWILVATGWGMSLEWIQPTLGPAGWHREALPLLAAGGVVLFLLAESVHYLLATFEQSRLAERNALELQVLARDAQLKSLRAQIDPHFLFNSLNSISALTSADPPGARTMTLLLADFLRLSMSYGSCATITLDQEIGLATRFLEIEKVRFGERLTVHTTIDADTGVCRIPPLLLQPLVENAVNHGIATALAGGTITIRGAKQGATLHVTVENPVETGHTTTPGTGMGLENVRQRLRGAYGTEGRLDIARSGTSYLVDVNFPATDVP